MTPGFRDEVRESLDDPRPAIPAETVDAHFAARRKAAARGQHVSAR